MQIKATLLAAFAVLTSIATAAPAKEVESPEEIPVVGPFALKIASSNSTWNNKYVSMIHIGAAINLAVAGPQSGGLPFYLNSTEGGWVDSKGVQYGRLSYTGNPNIPYNGGLSFDTSSNIAPLLISVLEPTYTFNLNRKGYLQINGLERWFICTVPTAYGPKSGVSWQLGTGPASIKDCVAIRLQKKPVKK